MDLKCWMGHLPEVLQNTPIIYLAIPGTHDSAVNSIVRNSPTAPDGPGWLEWAYKFFPWLIGPWIKTQRYSLIDQLRAGIRYLDLRVARYRDEFYFCHGLFTEQKVKDLQEIVYFVKNFPSEVVVLDFQHVYCTEEEKGQLAIELETMFGSKMCKMGSNPLDQCTLQKLVSQGTQVLIIFRSFYDPQSRFYSDHQWPTPWPRKTKTRDLREFLEDSIKNRYKGQGYVSQCVLTPDQDFILANIFKSLESACAKPVLNDLRDWISDRNIGLENWPSYNVFIADYVDLNSDRFTATVININFKRYMALRARQRSGFLEPTEGNELDNSQTII